MSSGFPLGQRASALRRPSHPPTGRIAGQVFARQNGGGFASPSLTPLCPPALRRRDAARVGASADVCASDGLSPFWSTADSDNRRVLRLRDSIGSEKGLDAFIFHHPLLIKRLGWVVGVLCWQVGHLNKPHGISGVLGWR